MKPKKDSPGEKVLATNRLAFHNYHIGEKVEAGLQLLGTEVKSLRAGGANLRDAYARIDRGEAFLFNCHIAPYSHGGYANHDPLRTRKLLLHRIEPHTTLRRRLHGGLPAAPHGVGAWPGRQAALRGHVRHGGYDTIGSRNT